MDPERISTLVRDSLADFYAEHGLDGEVTAETRLFGGSAQLDSIQLVTFIVEVEQVLGDALGVGLTLADERAMSRERRSRFTTANCSRVPSLTTSGHSAGSIGSVERLHRFQSGFISCGSASATRCPIAHVTT